MDGTINVYRFGEERADYDGTRLGGPKDGSAIKDSYTIYPHNDGKENADYSGSRSNSPKGDSANNEWK